MAKAIMGAAVSFGNWISKGKRRGILAAMKSGNHRETEIKLRMTNVAALRRRLRSLGARRIGRVFERDVVFDTPDQHLARTGRLLRLRESRGTKRGPAKYCVTWKGPVLHSARHKVRQEVNLAICSGALFEKVLLGIGHKRTFVYEKWRTSFRLPRVPKVVVELDQTPIGWFLELEGGGPAIDRAAGMLGEHRASYIRKSYRELYVEFCHSRHRRPGNMVFARNK